MIHLEEEEIRPVTLLPVVVGTSEDKAKDSYYLVISLAYSTAGIITILSSAIKHKQQAIPNKFQQIRRQQTAK